MLCMKSTIYSEFASYYLIAYDSGDNGDSGEDDDHSGNEDDDDDQVNNALNY